MFAAYLQLCMGIDFSMDHNVEGGQTVRPRDVFGAAVGLRAVEAEPEQRALQTVQRRMRAGVIVVGHHIAGFLRHQLRKGAERMLDVSQILEKVQMVGFHIQNDGDGGIKAEKTVAVFAGFQNDGVPMSHPVAGVQQGQRAADHDGGILLSRHEDVGTHGGGGGFAVSAGDAQGVLVPPHQRAPCLRPLIDGDAAGDSAGNFRVSIVNGGGADHKIAVPQIFGVVADGHRDALGPQMLHGVAVGHVGTLHQQAFPCQHLRQRTHGHAADAHQMGALAGNQKFRNGLGIVHHIKDLPFRKRRRCETAENGVY